MAQTPSATKDNSHIDLTSSSQDQSLLQRENIRLNAALKLSEAGLSESNKQLILLRSANKKLVEDNRILIEEKKKLESKIRTLEGRSEKTEQKEPSALPTTMVWQYETASGWVNYDADTQNFLTLNLQNVSTSPDVYLQVPADITPSKLVRICLNPEKMFQEDVVTNAIKNVRFVEQEGPDTSYPSYWKQIAPDRHAYAHDIPRDSDIFKEVARRFYESAPSNYEIFNVQYVQASERWDLYVHKRAQWFRRLGGNLNERQLWHGTDLDNLENIANQGFLRQFTIRAAYGNGTYFAKHASVSAHHTYSTPCSDGFQRVILSRVLVGEYEKGCGGMKIPNMKPHDPKVPFESTVDNVRDPRIFVIYQDDQAYPEFIVAFKKVDKFRQPAPHPPPGSAGVFLRPNYVVVGQTQTSSSSSSQQQRSNVYASQPQSSSSTFNFSFGSGS